MMSARLVALSLALCAPAALAARVEIPLHLPLDTVRAALGARLVYREGPCRRMDFEATRLEAIDGRLRLSGAGAAALGMALPGGCRNLATWSGPVQFTLAPRLDSAGRLRLRIVGSNVGGAGFVGDLTRRQLHPRLQRFSYDVGAFRDAVVALLRSAGPAEHAAELETALTQMQVRQPRVETTRIVLPIAIEVPDAWLAPPAGSGSSSGSTAGSTAPLTEAELEALEQALQPWDAFLVYAIKHLALDNEDSALRKRLFTLLLDSRHQLVSILSGETRASGDPVRALFVETWNEMRAILADARYTLFLDAGDALVALDQAAPGLGMQLSSDGLRQLARSLRPNDTEDPLAHDWSVDPQLGRLFEVEAVQPESEPEQPPARTSWLNFLIRSAYAAMPALDRWVPKRHEMAAYETRVGDLLRKTSASELARARLDAAHAEIYRHMLPTTALIESCWRQYTVRAGKLTFLRSGSGSVGIMQINQVVWRGFYQVDRLRWDTAYNARAGAQILMRYLKDYAIPYAQRTGDPNDVPRAAYAVYNAGPRAVGRFNKVPPHPREQRVDDHLWELYQGMASGGQVDLRNCNVSSSAASR
jgi:hypothetical protein